MWEVGTPFLCPAPTCGTMSYLGHCVLSVLRSPLPKLMRCWFHTRKGKPRRLHAVPPLSTPNQVPSTQSQVSLIAKLALRLTPQLQRCHSEICFGDKKTIRQIAPNLFSPVWRSSNLRVLSRTEKVVVKGD